ncbi:zinc metalloproteinase nas-4-like [Nymphalis io]|uniref:zinc metalloproteinase nas-4-like n=1 Tax=Inachis io TaxID=171585 RepID=UPI00216993A4|nr:zinc metalloproteinase nas-4-like [Nymphalis io]
MKLISIFALCHVCVMKCLAMSTSELEDFSNFLKETSQLDQSVKSGIPDDYDDDAPVSDHAWEESGKFEGDLILNERQRRMIVNSVAEGLARNGVSDTTKRWPNNEVIYFIQAEHFSSDQLQAIQDGIDDLARASCVKFRPYVKGDRDAVVIQGSRRGCFSQVGYQGGYQVLNLSSRHPAGRGCFRHGTIVHEMLHTLGFYHMQSSSDRDEYIDVIWENIVKNARHNFRKYNSFAVSDFGVGYDYDSVLHYSRKAFSLNGQDTLVPKQFAAEIGQRIGLSDKDTQKLNKMYCDADSENLADSDSSETPKKKKKTKNKPFEGHGLGYQQGKTVVIKLPKAAEAYQIQDSPQFSMFNYFSNTPQDLQPTFVQGTGDREEVIKKLFESPIPPTIEEYGKSYFDVNPQDLLNGREHTAIEPYTDDKQNTPKEKPSDELNEDLSNAFYRLSQIIKPQDFSKPTRNEDGLREEYGLEKQLVKYDEAPSKYKDAFTQNYFPKSSSSYNPLVNKEHDSFTLFGHHVPRVEKWYHNDQFNHKHYRDRHPTLDIYR